MTVNLSDISALQRSNVKMKNSDLVLDKINKIIVKKAENLQVIIDYDFTITKQHVNGQRGKSSFGLLSVWDKLPPGFVEKDNEIRSKYYPIEVDLKMSSEEKTPYMIEWYKTCEKLWSGVVIDRKELGQLVAEKGPELRDGTVELCNLLQVHKIPMLVLSAGLGDIIAEVLQYHGLVENEYFHIISNFFKLENNTVCGFGCRENGQFIHPFNKNGLGCSDYFNKISHSRRNVILLGDSLGDAGMDQGVPEIDTVLKIGFLYGTPDEIEKSLSKFLEIFDIVLIDDQTMDVIKSIIDLVIKQ